MQNIKMKKIISYSLWGDKPKYIQGALENIKSRDIFYNGWICRFYVHNSVPKESVDLLSSLDDCEVIIKNEEVGKKREENGMFWRFEVLKDPDVERFIIRDSDSRLTLRDKACVADWKKTKLPFHIIRDHQHHSTKIMGGMWGATREFAETFDYDKALSEFQTIEYNNAYGADQEFLARMIYPLIKNISCIHDDWDRYREGARLIPHLRNDDHHIGEAIEL